MDNDTLADYWRDISPILKEQAQEKRENCFNDRLEYAKKQFEENYIFQALDLVIMLELEVV